MTQKFADLDPALQRAIFVQQRRNFMASVGADKGFYLELGSEHDALFVRGDRTLVVAFDNLDTVSDDDPKHLPWGFGFLDSKGWSVLGVMTKGWTWYRAEEVFDFFDRLRDGGFFRQFDRVVFYGASMGGYAAAAFSAACPGATVISISPQATLERERAGWEKRYRKAWKRDFSGRYSFAPDCCTTAEKVHLFYDPYERIDNMHASLFTSDNVEKVKCMFMGHHVASNWNAMGILKQMIVGCIEDRLTLTDKYKLLRTRTTGIRFQREMLARVKNTKRHWLIAHYCQAVLNRRRGPHFSNALEKAQAALKKQKQKRAG